MTRQEAGLVAIVAMITLALGGLGYAPHVFGIVAAIAVMRLGRAS